MVLADTLASVGGSLAQGPVRNLTLAVSVLIRSRRATESWGCAMRQAAGIFTTEARIPAFKDSVKITIQRLYADLQKQMGAARRPSHLLLLDESLSHQLIDG